MVYYGVIWSYCRLVFTCFPLSSFCFLSCFHAFPVTVSVGFLSAFVSFCWSVFFPTLFFLLLHLHFVKFLLSACKYSFHPEVSFSRLVLRSGTKPKRRQKRRQNSRQAAWHEPGQELANLLPHPATTATTTIATAGHSCAFAAGICLTSTNKAPTAPASPRLLLLQLLLMLMLLVLVLVLVAAAVTCCDLLWLLSLLPLLSLLSLAAATAAATAATAIATATPLLLLLLLPCSCCLRLHCCFF